MNQFGTSVTLEQTTAADEIDNRRALLLCHANKHIWSETNNTDAHIYMFEYFFQFFKLEDLPRC
jgi:hypothetical protein